MAPAITPTTRAGRFGRLAEPHWQDPLDTSHSRSTGGRWNAPGRFGLLYLNGSLRMARLQADHRLAGHPYGIEDLDPAAQHDLVEVEVAEVTVQDCVAPRALESAGLATTYPLDPEGRPVAHRACRPVAEMARAAGLEGIACRSAVPGAEDEEELAIFDPPTQDRVTIVRRRPFRDWYLES